MDRTVDGVFADFRGRRAALLKALTTDSDEFRLLCDPEKGALCLFGYANEQWEVKLVDEEVPPHMPEPLIGMNIVRDKMDKKDWLHLVAIHCDSWLLAVACYFGARLGFDKADRQRLFTMINDLPTIFDVLIEQIEVKDDEFSTTSGACKKSTSDGYWVACNICHAWFHVKCAKVFLYKGAPIVPFECTSCTSM